MVADYGCSDEGGSGVVSCVGVLEDGTALTDNATVDTGTSALGPHTLKVNGTDKAGNQADEKDAKYSVVYERDGEMLQPINPDNSSVFNRGKAVPVKFRLKGDEPNGFDYNQFTLKKQKVSCTSFDAEGEEVESVATNPSQSFRYDSTEDQYISMRTSATRPLGPAGKLSST